MRELTPTDPRRVGGYLLLRRLGEGRSGVVYLACSLRGEPVALKLIRPAYAFDPAFRARFEADVAAARHVGARRLVTVAAADTAGGTVWAAYPYVAGPTLDETLAAHGPLPPRTVSALGALLAEALTAVHAAGLCHRDIRPGHVQLTLDGPRLTGFGGSGTRIGPPGFLSPEQAVGGAIPVGPPSDLFALGCLLTYAATGRGPFGEGSPRELLRRAAFDPPELADVPRGLLEVVRACLHRDPLLRPSALDLAREMAPPVGAGWLPGPLAREVAARYAAPLPRPASHEPADQGLPLVPGRSAPDTPALTRGAEELPEAEPPEPGAPEAPSDAAQPERPRPTGRRRALRLLGGAGALAVAGVGAGLLLRTEPRGEGPVGAGRRAYAIGLQANLSGTGAAAGSGQQRGLNMAVDELNRLGNLPFDLDVRPLDDAGDPELAREAARALVADEEVMAVIGPTENAVLPAVGDTYATAELPLLALSLTGPNDHERYGSLLVARPPAALAGLAAGEVLAERGARRVVVLDDRAAGEESGRVARALHGSLDRERFTPVARELDSTEADLNALAAELTADGTEAVVWCGRADGAGRLSRALRTNGYPGVGLATERAIGPEYFLHTGQQPDDWFFLAPYTDPRADPRASGFGRAHRDRFGWDAEPYAAEAYDAAQLLVLTLRETVESRAGVTRGVLLEQLLAGRYRGVARDLAFDAEGAYAGEGPVAYLYRAHHGELRFQGPVSG
ncbi:serine/threonine protein kinase /amino acid/amide ABC transporter substrate-binding protein, HAAT family [Streptomyces zhaozhouensis]|uniref:Serine/threonine protein kinase /amino acid/amide ABC transporter substrate-binding protein, HAAT family n=1 Tax=Streptomyces zhaozhouensis TaxID=1300267 RepID=A0A286E8V2_9ACTN|nr:bifunctional serine/threonine-protein kinase/ABC transporter substrate-binding protein [Streptomyces zhaozhouensis]SOD67310.1 serine/threonine protein kinase /amino acid/amide ABC transporter substrate-binding protein, HAAT family [Streptomyces zhaozhouensis]